MVFSRNIVSTAVVLSLCIVPSVHAQSLQDNAARRRAERVATTVTAPKTSPTPSSSLQKLISEEEQRIAAVEKANDAVVSIVATKVVMPGEPAQLVSAGSAFFVSADGYLLTNYHVIDEAGVTYTVMTKSGDEIKATVAAKDAEHDIALLHVDRSGTAFLQLAKPGDVHLAQTAMAIGNALGEYGNTVSLGIVSALRRAVDAKGGGGFSERLTGLIQTDAAINAGTSGGPLINTKGEAIGMTVARDSKGTGIGFAIPADRLREFLKSNLSNYK